MNAIIPSRWRPAAASSSLGSSWATRRSWWPISTASGSRMAARLMLARMERTSGFDGPGDFFLDEIGRLEGRRSRGAPTAPLNYMGVHIVDPRPIYTHDQTAFGLFPGGGGLWGAWSAAGRLHGSVMEGDWMHVGDPVARDQAEARLTG